jgi:4-amino-4-deoxy-L-arabinose transferase-like glycosyltransferase
VSTPNVRGDEGPAIFLRDGPVSKWWASTKADAHPPLYYVLLKAIPSFGSITPFRLLSVVASLGVIPLLFLLGKRLFSERVGLLSSFLFAVAQPNIKYAQIIRSYAVFTFLTMLAIYFFVSYLQDRKTKQVVLWVIASALACWIHYFFGFILLAKVVYVMFYHRHDKKLLKTLFVSCFLLALLIAPLLPIVYAQRVHATEVTNPAYNFNDPLLEFNLFQLNSNNLFVRIPMMIFHLSVGYHPVSTGLGFLVFIGFALAAFGLPILANIKDIFKKKVFFTAIFPITVLTSLSILWATGLLPYQTYARFILFVSPLYYLFIAKGVSKLSKSINFKKLAIVFIIIVLALNSISIYEYYTVQLHKDDFESLSENIDANLGDVILVNSAMYSLNLKLIYKGPAGIYLTPDGTDINKADITFSDFLTNEKPITSDNMCNFIGKIGSPQKIYLLQNNPSNLDSNKLIKQCLESNYNLINTYSNTYKDIYGEDETDFFLYEFQNS